MLALCQEKQFPGFSHINVHPNELSGGAVINDRISQKSFAANRGQGEHRPWLHARDELGAVMFLRQGSDISALSVIHWAKFAAFISAGAFEVGFMEKNLKDFLQSY